MIYKPYIIRDVLNTFNINGIIILTLNNYYYYYIMYIIKFVIKI